MPQKKLKWCIPNFVVKSYMLRHSTNISGLYGELGRVPLYITRKINILRYWYKLLRLNDHALPKIVYLMLRDDVEHGITYIGANWAFQIKFILESHGLGFIWQSQDIDTVPFSLIKQRIMDNYYQSWYAEINNSPRLSAYCCFKHNFNQEKYLDIIQENKYKIALSQFRISAHHLQIERGQYENVPHTERKCKVCNMNIIESKYHFLLVCPAYKDLRRKYFSCHYNHWPTITKFENLMSSESRKVIIKLAKAIFFLFLGLRILRPKFLHFRKKKKIFFTFFISSDVKNCQIKKIYIYNAISAFLQCKAPVTHSRFWPR